MFQNCNDYRRYINLEQRHTFRPGMIPRAASKQAPDMRPCSRSSGGGASPSLPSGSEPITLKYLTFATSLCDIYTTEACRTFINTRTHITASELDTGQIIFGK